MTPNLIILYNPNINTNTLLNTAERYQAILYYQNWLTHGIMLHIPEHLLKQAEQDFWHINGVLLTTRTLPKIK